MFGDRREALNENGMDKWMREGQKDTKVVDCVPHLKTRWMWIQAVFSHLPTWSKPNPLSPQPFLIHHTPTPTRTREYGKLNCFNIKLSSMYAKTRESITIRWRSLYKLPTHTTDVAGDGSHSGGSPIFFFWTRSSTKCFLVVFYMK